MIHAEIYVSGLVQGVGFRFFTVHKARQYRIKGHVKNCSNGNVFCVAEGDNGLVTDFIKELRIGPISSRVTDVSVEKSDKIKGYKTFEVTF